MSTIPYEPHRSMSTSALEYDPMESFSMMSGDDWSGFGNDFDDGFSKTSVNRYDEPETPLRKSYSSISPHGFVTPQSMGRSYSCASLPYTPSIHQSLPSPLDTPLGTPLDNSQINPFDLHGSKLTDWDFNRGFKHSYGSHTSLNSLRRDFSPLNSAKPVNASFSRRAARSSSISSVDSWKTSNSGRRSSAASGVNPFYCPPPCLRESPREEKPLDFDFLGPAPELSEPSSAGSISSVSSTAMKAAAAEAADSMFGGVDTQNFTMENDAGIMSRSVSHNTLYEQIQEPFSNMGHIGSRPNDTPPLSRERSMSTASSTSIASISFPGQDADKPFVCETCQKGFRRMEHLRRHTKTHTQERPYTCSIPNCGRKFSRTDNLKAHILTHAKKSGRNSYVEGLADMPQIKSIKKRKPKKDDLE